MNISREKLLNACKLLQHGLNSSADVITGGDCILFDEDSLRVYNERISLSYMLKTDIVCGVKANEFVSLLSKMNGEEITVELNDITLKVSDDTTTSTWSTLQYGALAGHIENLGLGKIKWTPLSKNFMKMLSSCYYSANKSDLLTDLCGICCDNKDIIACNNISVSWCTLDKSLGKEFILSVDSVQSLMRMNINFKEFCYADPWLHLSDKDNLIVSIHVLSGNYPKEDIKGLFNDLKGKRYSFPENFEETLNRVSVLSYQEESRIGIEEIVEIHAPRKGRLVCKGERTLGRITESVKIPPDSFPLNTLLYCNVQHLKDMLQKNREFVVNSSGALLFLCDEEKHLLFAMKGEEDEKKN